MFTSDNYVFVTRVCHTSFVATKVCLPRQNKISRDKGFVATGILIVATKDMFCRNKHVFVATKVSLYLSRQNYISCDKHVFVVSRQAHFLSRQKTCFCLSRQNF